MTDRRDRDNELDAAKAIGILQEEVRSLKAEVGSLRKWKEHCTIVAAGWGGICMAAITVGGMVHSYWDSIKQYFAGQK